jgi:Family of unknown function (DUF695)/Regulator of ribonuclease activity B
MLTTRHDNRHQRTPELSFRLGLPGAQGMSEDWDFYPLRVDDQPASIYCDIGIATQAPMPGFPHVAYLRLRMRAPRPDGLSSQEEYPALIEIEDKLSAAIADTDTIYVGRNTSNGCRDFYFYRRNSDGWEQQTAAIMIHFSAYQYETGVRHDAEWTSYRNFLYPTPTAVQHIQNRRVCDNLERQGDPLTATRDISHWAYFEDAESRTRFLARTQKLGFVCQSTFLSDRSNLRFGATVVRSDLPCFANIDDVVLPIYQAADECNGDYDGWETQVLKS